ncbi:uncharacterized protein LOC108678070 [Hyalella azteca]|uniref:Uncharacterized protein LOC108678070 n=1 Tax=Hyalella azteca TaxID=294128 RepID=A0A8B7P7T9_HYAAZ|nr:uncharacterized protein LOC108678070 [Hyalella azteca]
MPGSKSLSGDADRARGLTSSPAIRKLATIPFMDVVLPTILRSMGIQPMDNPEDNLQFLSMIEGHDRRAQEAEDRVASSASSSDRPKCVATRQGLASMRAKDPLWRTGRMIPTMMGMTWTMMKMTWTKMKMTWTMMKRTWTMMKMTWTWSGCGR